MEDVKTRLAAAIAEQLTGAPDGPAKSELIEELSDNLFARYRDMTASGMEEDAAFAAAMDDLGDTGELVDYLNSLEPGEPLPGPEPGDDPQSDDDLSGALKDLFQIVGETVRAAAGAAKASMDAVDVDGIVREAVDSAKRAARQAKDTIKDTQAHRKRDGYYTYASPNGSVHITVDPGSPPKAQEPGGPHFDGRGAWMEHLPGGDYAFQDFGAPSTAVNVEVGGDITVRMDDTPDGDVVIGGDLDGLDVRAADGVLTIRQGGTASRGFFLRRGMCLADVVLTLPRRPWEAIRLTSTASGDIDVDLKEPVEELELRTTAGDVGVELNRCGRLAVNTVSGDIDLTVGQAGAAEVRTVSGDVELDGDFAALDLSSTSGNVQARSGVPCAVKCASVSGDMELELEAPPTALEASTRSGDVEIGIPGGGPFDLDFQSASGECTSDFFRGALSGRRGAFTYRGGAGAGGPVYHIRTTSGDCKLNRL